MRTSQRRPAPRKSGALAIVLALLIPGLGHLYAGRVGAGLAIWLLAPAAFAIVLLGGLFTPAIANSPGAFVGFAGVVVSLSGVFYVWQAYDAFASVEGGGGRRRPR